MAHPKMSTVAVWLRLFVAIAIPLGGGILIGVFFGRPDEWFHNLKKPTWNPPNWLFGPAWTSFYTLMGIASYLVWRDGGGFRGAARPLLLYTAQLLINFAWTPMFFGLHSTILGLVNFVFLIPTAVVATFMFFRVNTIAGLLMIPYLLWLAFACYLNITIYNLN